jgi:hypothetical protein
MSLDRSLTDLHAQFRRLNDVLEGLSTTVEEDRPIRSDVVVASRLSDSILAMRGTVAESLADLDKVASLRRGASQVRSVAAALARSQERHHQFMDLLHHDTMSHARLDDLENVARDRGREWADWVDVARQALEQTGAVADDVRNALFQCWQELVEKLEARSVSIENTCVGQQVTGRAVSALARANVAEETGDAYQDT